MAFGSKLPEPVILILLKLCRSPEKQLQRLFFKSVGDLKSNSGLSSRQSRDPFFLNR